MSFIASKKPNYCPVCHGSNIVDSFPRGWVCEDCGTKISEEDSIFGQSMLPNNDEFTEKRKGGLRKILKDILGLD